MEVLLYFYTVFTDVVKAYKPGKKEPVYSEAADGKPTAVPASDFATYFKSKSSNGAIALQQEFKARTTATSQFFMTLRFPNLLTSRLFPSQIGKSFFYIDNGDFSVSDTDKL